MGRLRAYQNILQEAVQFYTAALEDLPEDLDDIQKGSFILDFGLAAFRYSAIENDSYFSGWKEILLNLGKQDQELLKQIAITMIESKKIAIPPKKDSNTGQQV